MTAEIIRVPMPTNDAEAADIAALACSGEHHSIIIMVDGDVDAAKEKLVELIGNGRDSRTVIPDPAYSAAIARGMVDTFTFEVTT